MYYEKLSTTLVLKAMDVRKTIEKFLEKNGTVRTADIVKATGFSRAYINRFLRDMQDKGRIVLIGKANQARYIPATATALKKMKRKITQYRRTFINKELHEEFVLADIKQSTGVFARLRANVAESAEYGFTEMLNNAIEHSRSKTVTVALALEHDSVSFSVIDHGIGIFRNIMQKSNVRSEVEAIQDLLKGKQTTAPEGHSGEGIFFTSKIADRLIINSSKKKLIFDNIIDDIFINEGVVSTGTTVEFHLSLFSSKNLKKIFRRYTDKHYKFDKTKITVHVFQQGTSFMSRSEARRILSGLEKFATVILDFKGVRSVGQGFADEIFRVWQNRHPKIKIETMNAGENVRFMINHVVGT